MYIIALSRFLTYFYLFECVLWGLNGHNYQKEKGPGTSNHLLFRLWNKFTKISLLVIQNLTKFDQFILS